MKRILLAVVVVVLVGVAAALFFVVRNLDAIVKAAIEKYGSELTGTPVTVQGVEIALREGRATVRGLRVGNPKGFEAPYAFSWDEVTVDIDPESVTSPPYVLDAVVIAAPEAVLELNERGEANLRVLQKQIRDNSSRGSGGGAGEGGKGEAEAPPRLRIASFRFERGALEARTAAVGGKDQQLEMPPLRLQGLGGPAGGTPAEIGRAVLAAYIEQSLRTAGERELKRQAGKVIDEQIDEQLEGEDAERAKKLVDQYFPR